MADNVTITPPPIPLEAVPREPGPFQPAPNRQTLLLINKHLPVYVSAMIEAALTPRAIAERPMGMSKAQRDQVRVLLDHLEWAGE